jgi:hypothetical protein
MEKEIENKILYLRDFDSVDELRKQAKNHINNLKAKYKDCVITKEFINGKDILIRCVKMSEKNNKTNENYKQIEMKEKEIYKEERTIGSGSRERKIISLFLIKGEISYGRRKSKN